MRKCAVFFFSGFSLPHSFLLLVCTSILGIVMLLQAWECWIGILYMLVDAAMYRDSIGYYYHWRKCYFTEGCHTDTITAFPNGVMVITTSRTTVRESSIWESNWQPTFWIKGSLKFTKPINLAHQISPTLSQSWARLQATMDNGRNPVASCSAKISATLFQVFVHPKAQSWENQDNQCSQKEVLRNNSF